MYQYMYVPLHTGGGALVDNVCCKHRELITQYAAQGWRYVGFVPTQFTRTGGIWCLKNRRRKHESHRQPEGGNFVDLCGGVPWYRLLGGAAARSDALLGGQYGQTAGNTGYSCL